MIRLGYVSLNTTLPSPNKTFRLANYSDERMIETARENLRALKIILDFNRENNIYLFRITSDLIPFGSHPINTGAWQSELRNEFWQIGEFIKANGMRVSFHPGQYTVLNTPSEKIFEASKADLLYHDKMLEMMGLNFSHRIVVHGGGSYGDKEVATNRLIERIKILPEDVHKRLALENDERVFNAAEIFGVCEKTKVPLVFDVFHHEINPSFGELSTREIILLAKNSWPEGERQKIHYSNQEPNKGKGTHSQAIDLAAFEDFYRLVADLELDIMIEVKDKEQSLFKIRSKLEN